MAKKNVLAEIYYGGAYQEVPLYQRNPVTIVRGLRDEAGGAVPQTASFTLDGRTDPWNPYDPASALSDEIARNAPVRVTLLPGLTSGAMSDVSDLFNRTSSSGWGTPDVGPGGSWSAFGLGGVLAGTDLTVSSGAAHIYQPVDSGFRMNLLQNSAVEDSDQVVTWSCPTPTGGTLEPIALLFRVQSSSAYLMARVEVSTASVMTINIFTDDVVTLLGTFTSAVTHVADTPYKFEVRTAGRDIFARLWDPASGDPTGWDLHVVDTDRPIFGGFGLRCGRATGNTNTTNPQFSIYDYTVTVHSARFMGELSSIKPGREIKTDKWADVEAGGILRRLAQRNSPERGALYQYLSTASSAHSYFPLEEASGTTVAQDVLTGASSWQLGSISFGKDPGIAVGTASMCTVDFATVSQIYMPIYSCPASWSVSWIMNFDSTGVPSAVTAITNLILGGGTASTAEISWGRNAGNPSVQVRLLDSTGSVVDSFGIATDGAGDPQGPRVVQFTMKQNGGNVEWSLLWSPLDIPTVYWTTTQTFAGTSSRITAFVESANFSDAAHDIGQVFVSDNAIPYIFTLAELARGNDGELAEDRLARFADDKGILIDFIGDADSTPAMSGQEIAKFVDLLSHCQLADQGILYEPRTDLGLAFRANRNLYNQTAALALDMATEGILPPLAPVVDDLPLENDITAKGSPLGGESRVEVTEGRMGVSDPPTGSGRVQVSYNVRLFTNGQLADWASWRAHLGTVDEARYTTIGVHLDAAPSLLPDVLSLDIGDVLTIDNLNNQDTVRLLILGYREVIESHHHMIYFVCAPASAYSVGQLDSATYGTLGSDGSSLASSFVAGTDTSMSVAVAAGYPLWTTGSVSLNVQVGRNVVAVSNISGASSPQTFTVSATLVSGVAKTIAAGAAVTLANPSFIGY